MTSSVAGSPKVLRRGRLSLMAESVGENASVAVLSPDVLPEEGNRPARRIDDPWFGSVFHSSVTSSSTHRLVPEEPDDLWLPGASMEEARNIILQYAFVRPAGFLRLEWSRELSHHEPTRLELGPGFARLSEKVTEFIEQEGLHDAMIWLITNSPRFFPGASFDVDVLDHEEGEDELVALRVHAEFATKEFRERRHRMCEAMLAADFRRLHELISIFQRSEHLCGRQIFSWYSSVTVE